MFKNMFKNEFAFTLIEMLIVLAIITMLLLIIIPNITSNSETIDTKGCEALQQTVQAQVVAYELKEGGLPTSIQTLVTEKYLTEDQTTCKNNKALTIVNGEVKVSE